MNLRELEEAVDALTTLIHSQASELIDIRYDLGELERKVSERIDEIVG